MSKIPFTDYFKMRSFVLENLFHETLDLEQMYAVGQATASDDDFLTLYHLTPKLFLEQGCRLVGRQVSNVVQIYRLFKLPILFAHFFVKRAFEPRCFLLIFLLVLVICFIIFVIRA